MAKENEELLANMMSTDKSINLEPFLLITYELCRDFIDFNFGFIVGGWEWKFSKLIKEKKYHYDGFFFFFLFGMHDSAGFGLWNEKWRKRKMTMWSD